MNWRVWLLASSLIVALPTLLPADEIYLLAPGELHRLSTESERTTVVGPLDVRLDALAFSPTDELYGLTLDGVIYQVDTNTAATRLVASLPGGPTYMDLAVSPDNVIYVMSFEAGWQLSRIDPATGSEELIGELDTIIYTIFFDGNQLIGLKDDERFAIDVDDATTSGLGTFSTPGATVDAELGSDNALWELQDSAADPAPMFLSASDFDTGQFRYDKAHYDFAFEERPLGFSVRPARACASGDRAGATLLFPYFEVDLADSQSRKTLISIQNTSSRAVLTNVVVWSNCGLPVLSFNLALDPQGVQPIDMLDLLVNGKVPDGNDGIFHDCARPISNPDLDEAKILVLQARLSGQPDPTEGLCYSSSGESANVATGYVTVDAALQCSDSVRTPKDPGYFEPFEVGGVALASNVLWGDFYLVDDSGNLAQGFEAVPLVADPTVAAAGTGFYGNGDDRRPLATRYRTRLIQGGSFDGGTELLAWAAPATAEPFDCALSSCGLGASSYFLDVLSRRESGDAAETHRLKLESTPARLKAGSDALPIEFGFGTVEIDFLLSTCQSEPCDTPDASPNQGWLLPIYTAQDRFSVGLKAVALDDLCSR